VNERGRSRAVIHCRTVSDELTYVMLVWTVPRDKEDQWRKTSGASRAYGGSSNAVDPEPMKAPCKTRAWKSALRRRGVLEESNARHVLQ